MIPTIFPHEIYKCPLCSITLQGPSITEQWKCGTCNSTVTIYAEDHEGRRHTINRLRPSEVSEDFLVVLPISGFQHIHSIIDVTKEDEVYRIALRNYRVKRYQPDELLNCVIGGW